MDEQTRAAYKALIGNSTAGSDEIVREDYEQAFENANKQLAETKSVLDRRGDNWAGATRNFARGLIPGALRAEAAIRSGSFSNEDYEKYKKNAYESAEGYAQANPSSAAALNIGGALAPSLALYFATPFTGGGSAAAATANLARAANVANTVKKASLGARSLRGLGLGGVQGAVTGFMDDPSSSLTDRVLTAVGSGALGGGLGGATPLALSGIGTTGNFIGRLWRGAAEEALDPKVVEDFALNSGILQNTPEASLAMDIVRKGSQSGALDIYKPFYNMNETLRVSKNMRKPGLVTNEIIETPAAQRIIDAGRTPQLDLAAKRYADFVAGVQDTPGQGLVANEFLKRNPVAQKILAVEPSLKDLPVGSFEWWQAAERTLNNSLPKNVDTSRLVGRRASIVNAIDDMSQTREVLHPGTTAANADYAVGKAWQERGNEIVQERLNAGNTKPFEENWGLSSSNILGKFQRLKDRGRARELILNGSLYDRPSQSLENAVSAEIQAIMNGLRNVSN